MAAEVNESYLRLLYAMTLEVKIYYPLRHSLSLMTLLTSKFVITYHAEPGYTLPLQTV